MKAFLLSGLCALSIACSPPPQKVAANRALLGDRLVNEKTFTDQVNATCGSGATNCSVLNKLTLSQSKRSKNLCLITMNQRKYCYYISM